MRITHVVRQFHPIVGGLEKFVLSLAKEQQKQGLLVEIVTLNRVKTDLECYLPECDEVEGVPVRRIGFVGSLKYPLAPAVLRHLKDTDIVHVHAVDFFCDFLALTRWLHGKPLVITTHGGYFHTPYARNLKRIFFATVTPLSMLAFDRVFACSSSDFTLFEPVAGRRRLRLIDNGVDTSKFHGASSATLKPAFIFIGRFASNKVLDKLIDTFGGLSRHVPDARLHIVGTDWGGLLAEMRERIANTLNGDSIKIHLDLSDANIAELMKECSFFISASNYEAFALTTIEGMAAGLIPITSRIECFQEVIDAAKVGMTTDFSDANIAGQRIAEFMVATAPMHTELRQRAMTASKPYDWSSVALRITREYETILAGACGALPA